MKARLTIVGADFGETGDAALRAGLQQLADGDTQGMYVVHVLATDSPANEPLGAEAAMTKAVAENLALRTAQLASREHLPYYAQLVRVEVRRGDVAQALLDAAREHRAELLIVGTHGRHGVDRLLAGSVAEKVVRQASCSVLVARVQPEPDAERRDRPRDPTTFRFDPGALTMDEP
jgi:nucleotide-binding universal stress UspA family protein